MNLDQQINVLTDTALKEKTLDVMVGDLSRYGDIYSDIIAQKGSINAASVLNAFNPNLSPCGQIVDISKLLQCEDYDFVENAYIEILGRVSDRGGLETYLTLLREGHKNKTEIIQDIADSDEAKQRGTLLTGFKSLEVSEFLQYHEADFIDMAYVLILGRHADPVGLQNYLIPLIVGEISKEEVLYALQNSAEAANRELEIVGLDVLYKKRCKKNRIWSIPVVGRCARWLKNLSGVNRKLKALTIREYSTERSVDRLRRENTELPERIEHIQNQLAETAWRMNDFDGRMSGLDGRMSDFAERMSDFAEQMSGLDERMTEAEKQSDKYVAESTEKIESVNRQTLQTQKQLEQVGRSVEETIGNTQKHLNDLQIFTNQIGSNVNDINRALENYDKIVGEYVREDKKIIQTLLAEVYTLKARISTLEKNGIAVNAQAQDGSSVPQVSGDNYTSIDYFDFENHFRGSREHVKKMQTMYLPYFEGKKKVLDLGCGRGEFTEMLQEQNVGVTGVDQYAPYVEYMKSLELPVVHDDAIHYLAEQESVDGIFLGQVVEHISTEQIMELCKLAYEKLEEGCYFIMETPNPTSLAIYTQCFYMDPSHQKPVHPLTLKYIAEKAGFSSVEILYTQESRMPYEIPKLREKDEDFREFNEAMGRVSDLLYGSQDYAIIAKR